MYFFNSVVNKISFYSKNNIFMIFFLRINFSINKDSEVYDFDDLRNDLRKALILIRRQTKSPKEKLKTFDLYDFYNKSFSNKNIDKNLIIYNKRLLTQIGLIVF